MNIEDERPVDSHDADLGFGLRDETIVHTSSSFAAKDISNETVAAAAHNVYHSVNVSVNNLLVKNKSGATGKNEGFKMGKNVIPWKEKNAGVTGNVI